MPYVTTAPNALKSPAEFPPQANTNFSRLKDIIKADHNFTDSTAVSQGIHKQVTMFNRSRPTDIPAGNGILYSRQVAGKSQLYWWNGEDNVVTPQPGAGFTQVVVSSQLVNNNSQFTIFPNPGYAYAANVFASSQDNRDFRVQCSVFNYTSAAPAVSNNSFTNAGLTVFFTNHDLRIENKTGANRTFVYIVQVQQTP